MCQKVFLNLKKNYFLASNGKHIELRFRSVTQMLRRRKKDFKGTE